MWSITFSLDCAELHIVDFSELNSMKGIDIEFGTSGLKMPTLCRFYVIKREFSTIGATCWPGRASGGP